MFKYDIGHGICKKNEITVKEDKTLLFGDKPISVFGMRYFPIYVYAYIYIIQFIYFYIGDIFRSFWNV